MSLIKTFIVMLIGVLLAPALADGVTTATSNANITGTAESLCKKAVYNVRQFKIGLFITSSKLYYSLYACLLNCHSIRISSNNICHTGGICWG